MPSKNQTPLGRRPSYSQEMILKATIKLLKRVPSEKLSMQRIAKELRTGASSIYAYFSSQEELFQALVNEMFAGIDLTAARAAPDWRDALRLCTNAIRDRMLQFPNIAILAARMPTHTPPSWFEVLALLSRICREAGLTGQVQLDAMRSISRIIAGCVVNEVMVDPVNMKSEKIDAESALKSLSPEAMREIGSILPLMGNHEGSESFNFIVDRLVDMLSVLSLQHSQKESRIEVRKPAKKATEKSVVLKNRPRKDVS